MKIARILGAALVFVALASIGAHDLLAQSGPCGEGNDVVTQQITRWLTEPEFDWVREELGVEGLNASALRMLGVGDQATCARLRRELPKEIKIQGGQASQYAVFFQIGDRYLVALRARPIDDRRPSMPPPDQTVGFDPDFNIVGVIVGQ